MYSVLFFFLLCSQKHQVNDYDMTITPITIPRFIAYSYRSPLAAESTVMIVMKATFLFMTFKQQQHEGYDPPGSRFMTQASLLVIKARTISDSLLVTKPTVIAQ